MDVPRTVLNSNAMQAMLGHGLPGNDVDERSYDLKALLCMMIVYWRLPWGALSFPVLSNVVHVLDETVQVLLISTC